MTTNANEKQDITNQILSQDLLNRQTVKSGTYAEMIAFATPLQGNKWATSDTNQLYIYYGSWISIDSTPAGVIHPFGGNYNAIPTLYLLCDGSAISRTTYANLFAVIGTNFGTGDGSTTFNLPDFRGKFPRGAPASTNPGGTGGEDTHVLSVAELATHHHSGLPTTGSASGAGAAGTAYTGNTTDTGSSAAHENRPAYQQVEWIIRT